MPTAARLRQDYSIFNGIDRSGGIEIWEVSALVDGGGLPTWTANNGSTVVLGEIPFAENDPHPDPVLAAKGVFLLHKAIQKQVSPTVAHCRLIWDNQRSFGFNVTPSSRVYANMGSPLELPQFTINSESSPGVANSWRRAAVKGALRAELVRVFTLNTSGSDGDLTTLTNDIIPNVGKAYNFGGIPYLLGSFSSARYNNGQIRVEYVFRSTAQVKAIPAGTVPGFHVSLPALDYLDEYAPDFVSSGTPPTVGVLLASEQYDAGLPLLGVP